MNPPATSQTRLKPAEAVSACTLAETMIEASLGLNQDIQD
jgi:hypothetical protein